MTGTWRLRPAYPTGSTMSLKACRCPAHHPNIPLTTNNHVPARPTPTNTPTPRHTHGRTRTPAPIRESDLNTIEIIIGRVPTHTPMGGPSRQGPIPSRSPSTPALTPTLCTNPRRLSLSRCHNQFPTCIQDRVVHERFPSSPIILCIIHTTVYRVGGPHTSSDHPSWEVSPHSYGCRMQLRRRNGPSRYSSACLRTSDLGGFPLLAPRQSPSTHHQGGTGGGAVSEFPVLLRLAPVRHRFHMLTWSDFTSDHPPIISFPLHTYLVILSMHTYVDRPSLSHSLPTPPDDISKISHDVLRLHYTRVLEKIWKLRLTDWHNSVKTHNYFLGYIEFPVMS
jgi:hypothetical protein